MGYVEYIESDYHFKYYYDINLEWREKLHDDLCYYIINILIDNNVLQHNYDRCLFGVISQRIMRSEWFCNHTNTIEANVCLIKSLFYIRYIHFAKNTVEQDGFYITLDCVKRTLDSIII